jgi:hypothetical protein
VTVVVTAGAMLLGPAVGAFTSSTASAASMAAGVLAPPTALTVEFDCAVLGLVSPVAELEWTPSGSAFADGYVLERWRGGVLEESHSIAGRTTDEFVDGDTAFELLPATAYTWRLRSRAGSWTSSNAVVTDSTPVVCL